MTINDWIAKQETDSSLTLEQFYARLMGAVNALEERLSVAESDGVDLEDVEPEDTYE